MFQLQGHFVPLTKEQNRTKSFLLAYKIIDNQIKQQIKNKDKRSILD